MSQVTDHLFAALQHALPQRTLTQLVNRVARAKTPWVKNLLIRAFAESFNINLDEARSRRPEDYNSFNEFFTRELKDGSRQFPGDAHALAAPSDGTISQMGDIHEDRIFQAKGIDYTLPALLGADDAWSDHYLNGAFSTIYLSPRDYHRVHMPLNGRLLTTRHVPGKLFSVNDASARTIPGLFARNERLVCRFEGEIGEFTLIMVGAMMVASIDTVWSGPVEWRRDGQMEEIDHRQADIRLQRGEEMGRFNYGSTVILLFPTRPFQQALDNGTKVRMGMPL
jgi:phosphatidylserine decarboxylase